jgi:hypothetical protein
MTPIPPDQTQLVVTLVEGPDRHMVTKVPRPAPASIRQVLHIARPPYDMREYHRLGDTTEYQRVVPGPPADAPPTCALCRAASQSKLYATGMRGAKHYCAQCYALMVSRSTQAR